jgi:tetratricopeptide (TPR) repeat protein
MHGLRVILGATGLACGLALGEVPAAWAAAARDPLDEAEVQAMRAASPHAAELLEKGERLAAAGDFMQADALFLEGQREYRIGSLLSRRDCEAKTALGLRNDAIQACTQAIRSSRSDPNIRALVRAFVDGPRPPSPSDLFSALGLVSADRARAPDEPTAAAAACDIAERIGDGVMLQRCAEELERIAPKDPATARAESLLSVQCPPWRFWGGWLALVVAIVVTVGHAIRRLVRRWPKRSSVVAAAALAAALCSLVGRSAAAEGEPDVPQHGWLSKWSIDETNPSAHIPSEKDRNAEPLQFGYWLQDVIWKGHHASKKGDHAAAAKLFGALADAVPDRAIGFTLSCEEYETLGDLDHAINACGQALLRDGVLVKDFAHFVQLVLVKPGPLEKKEKDKLAEVLAHMRADPAAQGFVDDLECQVGVRASNVAELRECTAALAVAAPDSPKVLVYQWNLAIEEREFALARGFMDRAGAAGLAPEKLAEMRKVTSACEKWYWTQIALVVFAVALLLGGSWLAARAVRRRRSGSAGAALPSVEKAAIAG